MSYNLVKKAEAVLPCVPLIVIAAFRLNYPSTPFFPTLYTTQ